MLPPNSFAMVLGVIFGGSELVIASVKRSRGGATRADKGSLPLLWIVIFGATWLAFYVAAVVPAGHFLASPLLESIVIVLLAVGLALRWYSIIHLGRLFTVDVAVAADHRLIDTGPYRYIRHPSYTGAMIAFLGLGLSLYDALSIPVIMLPIILTYAYRIRVEEAALRAGIGPSYAASCAHTRRLIPGLF
jgi:protein-S-isoprenylcysteine O-methyltransferase Ste14